MRIEQELVCLTGENCKYHGLTASCVLGSAEILRVQIFVDL